VRACWVCQMNLGGKRREIKYLSNTGIFTPPGAGGLMGTRLGGAGSASGAGVAATGVGVVGAGVVEGVESDEPAGVVGVLRNTGRGGTGTLSLQCAQR